MNAKHIHNVYSWENKDFLLYFRMELKKNYLKNYQIRYNISEFFSVSKGIQRETAIFTY